MWPTVERLIERYDGSPTLLTVIRRLWGSFRPTDQRAGCTSARSASVPRRCQECEECGDETFLCPTCHKCSDCCGCDDDEEEEGRRCPSFRFLKRLLPINWASIRSVDGNTSSYHGRPRSSYSFARWQRMGH